jgi:hypothetical protein
MTVLREKVKVALDVMIRASGNSFEVKLPPFGLLMDILSVLGWCGKIFKIG